MIQYLPELEAECLLMEQANPLYSEILARRRKSGCYDCEYAHAVNCEMCKSCYHKKEKEDGIQLNKVSELNKLSMHKITIPILGCLCTKRDFTGVVSMYFNVNGELGYSDIRVKYCPLCGKKILHKK